MVSDFWGAKKHLVVTNVLLLSHFWCSSIIHNLLNYIPPHTISMLLRENAVRFPAPVENGGKVVPNLSQRDPTSQPQLLT